MQDQLEDTVRRLSLAGRHDQAIAIARQGVAAAPNNALNHFTLGRALVESDRRDEGLFHVDKAATLDMGNFLYAYYAGWLYSEFRLYEFALPLLQRSVAIEGRSALSRLALAQCYDNILHPEKANEHYAAAVKLEESRSQREYIQFQLARNLAHSNQQELAKERFEQIFLAKGEKAFDAAIELALLSKEGPQSRIGTFLNKRLSDKNIKPMEKSRALLALGKMHDNVKDHDRAFGCWKSSRDIAKTQDYRVRNHDELVALTKSAFTAKLFDVTAPYASQTDAVVVVSGMPRSGTTLTEQIIASHSQAAGAGEVARWNNLEHEFFKRHNGRNPATYFVQPENRDELRIRGEEILRIMRVVSGSSAPRIVDKTPHSFVSLGYIKLCCPKSKFIHIQRHPLDTFISTYQNAFNKFHGYAYDQVEYAKEYLWQVNIMDYWKSVFPENILTVKYEDLAREPEANARKIIAFIGLEWEEQCLEFHTNKKAVRTFSTSQVRKPVSDSSIGRWKLYEKHLGPIREHLEKAGFNYE